MGFRYKPGVDILALLKEAGYSTYRLQKENLLNQTVLQNLRHGEMITLTQLEKICKLLKKHPRDIIEYVDENFDTER